MKKEYIKPNLVIVNACFEVTMMSSSYSGVTDTPLRPDAIERRDFWEDPWN